MRKYLYFLSADVHHLHARLDKLAKQGLELTSTQGLFIAQFEETKRTDLKYLLVAYGAQKNFPRTTDFSAYGWDFVGGYNGMAIFKSFPCVEPDGDGLVQKLKADGCVHPDKHTISVLQGILFLYAAVLFLLPVALPELDHWYLSYYGVGLPVLRAVVLGLLAANLLTLRTYVSAWVHGLTPWLLVGSSVLYLVIGHLNQRGNAGYFAVLLIFVAAACLVSLWRMNRGLAIGAAAVCCVVLCLGLLFPSVDLSGTNLRGMAAKEQVVTLADLGDASRLTASGLEKEGTLLVGKTTYWEVTENGNLTCEVYHCLTSALGDEVVRDEQRTSSDDGKTCILRYGKTVAVISSDQIMEDELVDVIWEKLF